MLALPTRVAWVWVRTIWVRSLRPTAYASLVMCAAAATYALLRVCGRLLKVQSL